MQSRRTLTLTYLRANRSFIGSLVRRDIKQRYAHSVLGLSWMVIEPLIFVLALSAIFTMVEGMQGMTDGHQFPVFFYAGILPWRLFTKALTDGAHTFIGEAALMKKFSFPRQILIGKNLCVYLIEFFLASFAFLVVLAICGVAPNAHWALLPLVLVLQLGICAGIMMTTASINVYIRDVGTFLAAISQILFWLSPVVWRVDPNGITSIVTWINPFAGVIESIRFIVLDNAVPPFEMMFMPLVWCVVLNGVGLWVFRKVENGFVDAL